MKYLFLLIVIGVLWIQPHLLYAQDLQNSKCVHEAELHNVRININLLCDYFVRTSNWERTATIAFSFRDNSHIVVVNGAYWHRFPILHEEDGYLPHQIDTLHNRIIRRGVKNGKYWREDAFINCDNCRLWIFYNGVLSYRKEVFDEILESLIFEKIVREPLLLHEQPQKTRQNSRRRR